MNREDATIAHWNATQKGDLPQFVIYRSPADYPGKYVVRMWRTLVDAGPTPFIGITNTLDAAREIVPFGLFRMQRFVEDDPCIVEVWF